MGNMCSYFSLVFLADNPRFEGLLLTGIRALALEQYSRDGLKCVECAPGSQPEPGTRASCALCPTGKASFNGRVCSACPSGMETPGGSGASVCSECKSGSYDHDRDAVSPCTACPRGTFLGETCNLRGSPQQNPSTGDLGFCMLGFAPAGVILYWGVCVK